MPQMRSEAPFHSAFLFVHGIGTQEPGATLRTWAPHLLGHLRILAAENAANMNSASAPPKPVLTAVSPVQNDAAAALVSRATDKPEQPRAMDSPDGRSYEVWTLHAVSQQNAISRQWLITESCWAKSFALPSMSEVRRWALRLYPRFVFYHTIASLKGRIEHVSNVRLRISSPRQLAWGSVSRYLTGWLSFFVFLSRAFVLYFAYWRLVGDQRMPDVIGDSLAAVEHPTAKRAMLARISADLEWCLDHVNAQDGVVILVAHSQGAMLVRQLLADSRSADYASRVRLITVGAGIAPLHSLRYPERRGAMMWSWIALGAWGFFSLAPFLIAWLLVTGRGPGFRAVVVLLIAFALAGCGGVWGGIHQIMPSIARLRLGDRRVARWVDISSRFDAVSCGPLLCLCDAASECVEVVNGGSIFLEHSRYQANPLVMLALSREMDMNDSTTLALRGTLPTLYRDAGRRNRRRQAGLAVQRLLLYMCGCIFALLAVMEPAAFVGVGVCIVAAEYLMARSPVAGASSDSGRG